MKCKHCGAEIPEWMDFCPECAKSVNDPVPEADAPAGEAAPVKAEEELKKAATVEFDDEEEEELVPEDYQSPQRPKKTRRRKKKRSHGFLWFLLGVVLTAAVGWALLHFGVLSTKADQPIVVSADSAYTAPADAINAYAKGLKDGDLKDMLKTFAAETYLQHVPTAQNYTTNFDGGEVLKVWGASSAELQAAGTPLSQAVAAEKVRSYLTDRILDQFTYPLYHNSEYYGYDQETGLYLILAKNEDDMNDFISKLPENAPFKEVTIGDAFEVSDKLSEEAAETYKAQMEAQKTAFGADDVAFYYLSLNIDGEDYLLGMELVQYDGKWYNNDPYLYGLVLKDDYKNNSYGGLVPVAAIDSWQ